MGAMGRNNFGITMMLKVDGKMNLISDMVID